MSETEGILNIDKAPDMTSHDVVNGVRRLAGLRRVGHAGTLDPLATGVLLVCLGRATRLVEYLVGQPKTYEATIRLGQSTNTYDADGEITAERPLTFSRDQFDTVLAAFLGDIQQVPPLYSAIKKDGQPLYKLARKGIEVEVPPRQVSIYALELLSFDLPQVKVRIRCSSGTYIRSIAHDLGEMLTCGGHITALRRTAVGTFNSQQSMPLAQLTPENLATYLQPKETAVAHLPRLEFPAPEAAALWQGQAVARHDAQPEVELVRAFAHDGTFLGVVQRHEQQWQARKMFPPV